MILIVDSEKIPESIMKNNFNEYGFKSIEIAKTAENARKLIKNNGKKITLIIINSELVDANGFEFCREIKKRIDVKFSYVMMLISSLENKTAIEKSKHSGASGYAVKPYFSSDFQKHFFNYMINRVVILVDDDPVIRQLVRNILCKSHVEVIEIEDGIEANNLFNKILPSKLVLMDIDLPNMNGIQLIQNIRHKSSWRKTPIVMLTGSSDTGNVKTCLSAGANDYLTKPIDIDAFKTRIARFLPNES